MTPRARIIISRRCPTSKQWCGAPFAAARVHATLSRAAPLSGPVTNHDNLPAIDPVAPGEELDAAVADALLPYTGELGVRAIGAISDLSDQEPLYAAAAGVLATAAVMR